MALSKIQAESMNLADTYAFTGTVSGAGSHEKLHSITSSNGDSDWTFSSTYITNTYDKYFFTFQNILPTNDSNYFIARISFDNGTFYKSSDYKRVSFEGQENNSANFLNANYSTGDSYMMITGAPATMGNEVDESFNGVAYFHNTTTDYKSMNIMGQYHFNGNQFVGVYSVHQAHSNRTDKCNNIKFYFNSGTIKSGKITLYGVRQ